MLVLLVLLVLAVGCSAPPEAPPTTPERVRPEDVQGFETTRFGMQPAELKAGLGWPVAPCQDDDRQWCLDSFTVDGHSCEVRFSFQEGLDRVVVSGRPEAYPALLGAYRGKWGPPDESQGQHAVWRFPSCRIELTGGNQAQMVYTRP